MVEGQAPGGFRHLELIGVILELELVLVGKQLRIRIDVLGAGGGWIDGGRATKRRDEGGRVRVTS